MESSKQLKIDHYVCDYNISHFAYYLYKVHYLLSISHYSHTISTNSKAKHYLLPTLLYLCIKCVHSLFLFLDQNFTS